MKLDFFVQVNHNLNQYIQKLYLEKLKKRTMKIVDVIESTVRKMIFTFSEESS
jgi:hypothetical protein